MAMKFDVIDQKKNCFISDRQFVAVVVVFVSIFACFASGSICDQKFYKSDSIGSPENSFRKSSLWSKC